MDEQTSQIVRQEVECPHCGRTLRARIYPSGAVALPGHYNPANPPIYGYWLSCPGPTQEQREEILRRHGLDSGVVS